jgi:hypothetical protein
VIVVAGAATAFVAGAIFFQPWRLWTNTEVRDDLPPAATSTRATAEPPQAAPTPPSAVATPVEEVPPAPEPAPIDLATGTFISHEHTTSGDVRIVQQPDGSRVLAIAGLQTSDGPDLRVRLSDAPVIEGVDGWYVFDDGDWTELGPLKGNLGDQVYPIPADIDLARFSSVSIWCSRFSVSFGAAALR